MLQFIFGTSGTGKTTYAKNLLAQLRQNGNNKLLMLVPEQSSFATESSFLDILGPKDSRDILVFGFSRLCNYVFNQTGNNSTNVIDDGVRCIIMSKTLDEVSDNLTLFNSKNTHKSTLDLMIHSLKECKKDNITPDMLTSVAELVEEESLKLKLNTTALVLEAYEAIIKNTYIDPLDDLNKLVDILACNKLFEDYTLVIDSFSGFTYQQLQVLEVLMKQCKDTYITLNLDNNNSYLEIFETTARTKRAIKRIASSNGIQINPHIVLNEQYRFNDDALKFVQNNVFRYSNVNYTSDTDAVRTFVADNIYSEVEFVATNIKKLVVENDYSYNDIAVVTRDISKYIGVLDSCMEKLDIPYFMDIPQDIYTRPIVRFLICALDFVNFNFDRDKLLLLLKTGLMNLTELEIADFENYIYMWDIDRKNLTKEFIDNPSGFSSFTDADKEKLASIENTRKQIIIPFENFAKTCKNATGLQITKAFYKLFEDFSIPDTIIKLYDNLEAQGLVFEANEEVRIYNLIIETFDKLVAVICDDRLDLKKYKEYLDYKLQDISISDIPRYQDQVSVATADRVRLNSAKAVFVIGAIDGEFPSVPKTAGIFTENERRLLINNKLPLTDSLEDLTCHEKFLAYCVLTSASDKLFVTSYTSDYAGNSYTPSEIIAEVTSLFPDSIRVKMADFNPFSNLMSEKQALEVLSKNYKENTPEVSSLKQYFNGTNYNILLENIDSVIENKPVKLYDKQNAENLFSKNLHISASQLEKFNLCAFQYFCSYGLRVNEKRKASIDAMQFGNVVHHFMEVFLKSHSKDALNLLSDDEIKTSIDTTLNEYAEENFGGLSNKSNSFLNLYERLKSNIFILTKEIIKQLATSDFKPTDFELSIGKNGDIPEYRVNIDVDKSVSVMGYIDRVDTMRKTDDEVYVRVIDYKTGNKVFKLSEILYGINMQMLIYLKALVSNGKDYYGKNLVPTGILYMPSFTSEIDADSSTTDDDITKELDKNFMMNGLILDDDFVLNSMDAECKSIKLKRKAKESVFSESFANSIQFEYIFAHIDNVLKDMGRELLDGNISPVPLKGVVNGCKYCPYDSVCGRKPDGKYKFGEDKTVDDIYRTLGMEVNADE